jgi:phosphate:Na+ symporter
VHLSVTEPNGKLTENISHRKNLPVVFFVAAAAVILLTYGYEAFADNGDETAITGEQIRLLIFNLLGGIALLIYGINRMGEGLQKAAGDRMRSILGRLTNKPLHGVMVGAGVTALIQSSSATTVMVVGFVNARLMTLVQAIGVIVGANIGTTITGQLIAFKLTDYALPIVAVGVGIHFFTRRRFIKHIGLFILGFGVLFLGLNIMKDGVHFLRDHPGVSEVFQQFGEKPLLGVLAGTIITAIIQSS